MTQRLRWGILGTGNIARQFAGGVATSARGAIVAVASRDGAKAQAFAAANGVGRSFGSYEALLSDPAVDAVYVSLPNSMHHHWTIAALRAAKHVLCEKPFAVTAAEAKEMFDAADRAGRVVMEAFMYRCHPQTLAVVDLVRSGAIGDLKLIRTSFCYRTRSVEGNIRFQPALAGGALMDIGCYCLSLSRLLARAEPEEARVTGTIYPVGGDGGGVDDFAAGWLRFPGGITASFTCGMGVQADNAAYVCGSDGYIEIPVPWKPPARSAQHTLAQSATPKMDQKGPAAAAASPPPRTTYTIDAGRDLFGIEADAFAAAVFDGKPVPVSRQDTMGNVLLLEQLRRQLGLKF